MDPIFRDGVLVDLDVSRWSGARRLSPEELGWRAEEFPEVYSTGSMQLIPKAALERFAQLGSQARYLLERQSFAFPIGGARFVPRMVLPELVAQLEGIKTRFAETTRTFLDEYVAVQAQMTPTWREIAKKTWEKAGQPEPLDLYEARFLDAIAAAYPPAARLQRRFGFAWVCYTIQVAHWEAVDAWALAQEETQRRALETEYRAQAEARIGAFVDEVVDTLRGETAALCQRVIAHIQSGKAVTERTLKSLGAFVSRFKTLNFVGDQAIEAQLETLRSELLMRHSAAEFRDDAALTGLLKDKLAALAAQAESISDRAALTGEYRRRIRRVAGDPAEQIPEEATA
jgi:hypothetical protein